MIFIKKKDYFENKLNILVKQKSYALRSIGLPKKISSSEVSGLKVNNTAQHDTNSFRWIQRLLF